MAAAQNISVADVVRRLLCDRYELSCPPVSRRGYEVARDSGAANILLRLQPKLMRRLEREAAETGKTKRAIVLEAIAEKGDEG